MRFAYVAAGAVVLGAAVVEARSVPSSPQRTPKAAKRQIGQPGSTEIQPLIFSTSGMMKSSKAIPFTLKDEVDDGISGFHMVNDAPNTRGLASMPNHISIGDGFDRFQPSEPQLPDAQAFPFMSPGNTFPAPPFTPPGADAMALPARMEIINVNPNGVPDYVTMEVVGTQEEIPTPSVLNGPRRYQPSPLATSVYLIHHRGGSIPEPVFSDPLEAFHQPSGSDVDQSTMTDPSIISGNLPPPPLLRALSEAKLPVDPTKIFKPSPLIDTSENNTIVPETTNFIPDQPAVSENGTSFTRQAPIPVFRTLQLPSDNAASKNGTSMPSFSSDATPSLTSPPSVLPNETTNANTDKTDQANLSTPTGSNMATWET